MSEYNLKLREREEEIQIKRLVTESGEKIRDPKIHLVAVITDQKNRKHLLEVGKDLTFGEWVRLKEGSVLAVGLREEIKFTRLLRE